jgi:signal transduction histidine kinase
VRVTAASDLPQAAADRTQLQQVVLNLVINAIEAMSTIVDRARTVDIDLRRQAPDMLSVAVRDSGVGLPDNQRDRIFDPFHSTKPHGMGLGLAISRSIIEAHGGRLWATGSPSHGAIFRFTLPVAVHR